jgi:hypothetical protein
MKLQSGFNFSGVGCDLDALKELAGELRQVSGSALEHISAVV